MTQPNRSYIDELRAAKGFVDDFEEPFKEAQERERLVFAQFSERWAAVAGLALRALGQGADAADVVEIVQGRRPEKWADVEDFVRFLHNHLVTWVIRETGIRP